MNKREAAHLAALEVKIEQANRRLLDEVDGVKQLCSEISARLQIIETERLAAILAAASGRNE